MSPEALARTGYFDPQAVLKDYNAIGAGEADKINVFLKMGLTGVLSTQLWHHLYMGGGLASCPSTRPARRSSARAVRRRRFALAGPARTQLSGCRKGCLKLSPCRSLDPFDWTCL